MNTKNNKQKGSTFEREIAKKLSIWIYNKPSVIRRHPTSGSEKDYGQGSDIGLFQPNYEPFNYFVEVKCGYKDDIFNARKQILNWYYIAKEKNKKEYPIWIIWKLLNKGIILASDNKFKINDELFNLNNLYIYDFKKLLEMDFHLIK